MRSFRIGANLAELLFIASKDSAISERNFRHVRKVAWFAFSEKWKTLEDAQERGPPSNVFEALREI